MSVDPRICLAEAVDCVQQQSLEYRDFFAARKIQKLFRRFRFRDVVYREQGLHFIRFGDMRQADFMAALPFQAGIKKLLGRASLHLFI